MKAKEADTRAERSGILVAGVLALGAAAVASLFAPVESREAAPVLGIMWLLNLLVGGLLLLLWAAWRWLEPRRRRTRASWETRLVRCRLRHYEAAGMLDEDELHRLEAWLDRRERAALRRLFP